MRQSNKGINSKQYQFAINQLIQKSHFSPPLQPNQQSFKNHSIHNYNQHHQIISKPQSQHTSHTQNHQSNIQVIETFQINSKQQVKSIQSPFASTSTSNNIDTSYKIISQTKNTNYKFTIFTCLMYFGIFLFICDYLILIIPSMYQIGWINKITQVVLGVLFILFLIIMLVSYQKARRLSPGYPIKLNQRYKLQKIQQALCLPQIQQLKSKTMQLLIKKAQLKQNIITNLSQQNQQLLKQFQANIFYTSNKYCEKCYNIKQPRVRHCGQCNRCIQRMDHHCVWLNNCVGKNNHKFFMLFLFMLIIMLTFFIIIGIIELILHHNDNQAGLAKFIQNKYTALWKLAFIIGQILATGLWVYYVFVFCQQIYLISNNLTFVQSLSQGLSQKKPWKHDNCCNNFSQVFGSGCWICPTQLKQSSLFNKNMNKQSKKNPSVQLVQQVLGSINGQNLTNFNSQNHFKHTNNQI